MTLIPKKAIAPRSSTLAWKSPWTEHPGRLQSLGSLRVGHDWATSLSLFTFLHWRRKWQPIPVFLPWESQGWGSLVAVYGVTQSWTRLKQLSNSSSRWLLFQRRKWQPNQVFLPRESHVQRTLMGCCPWGCKSQSWLKGLNMHACIGEGNGNSSWILDYPVGYWIIQYPCLENPRDRGAWWAAVCGVAQSQTWL